MPSTALDLQTDLDELARLLDHFAPEEPWTPHPRNGGCDEVCDALRILYRLGVRSIPA